MDSGVTNERWQHILKDYPRGFIAYCGLTPTGIGHGHMEARVNIKDEHRQQDGFIHAGVMATMADHTAGYAAYTLVPEDRRILTIEFKINFLRPAYGAALVCRAKVIKPGQKVLICQSEVFDVREADETMVAIALATMAAVPITDLRAKTRVD